MYTHTVCTEGEAKSIKDQDQPVAYHTGLFAFPQPVQCSGTLVSITAHGFCIPNDSYPDGPYRLRLCIARANELKVYRRVYRDYINAVCSNANNDNDTYAKGTLTKELNITVIVGDIVGVRIEECSEVGCPFLPVFMAGADSSIMYDPAKKFRNLKSRSNTSLNIQVVIDKNNNYLV